jgi:signal transduction histidine kinase
MSSMTHSSNGSLEPGAKTNGAQNTVKAKLGDADDRAEEIAVICHELRNSLAVVRGAARLLRSTAASERLDTARSLIERHAGQMSRHIEDLLEPMRRVGRDHGLQLAHIDLRAIARHATDAIAPEMTRRGHRLTVQVPDEPIWAHADGTRLEQVFSNLLINAAKYTPDGGDITLTLERDDEQVRVRIRDSGVGIEPAMLSRVFEMFVQVDSDQPSAGGQGIGLAVVQNLVEMHGGSVKATSPGLGFGSEFIVALPALWAHS